MSANAIVVVPSTAEYGNFHFWTFLEEIFLMYNLGVRGVGNLQVNRNATCNINIPYYNVLQNAMGGNFNLLSLWTKLMETTLLNQQTGFLIFFKFFILYIYIYTSVFLWNQTCSFIYFQFPNARIKWVF